jgi:imidazolonepropionase
MTATQCMTSPARIWRNARLLTFDPARSGMGAVEKGAVAAEEGRIVFAGKEADAPGRLSEFEEIDCEGRWITPGLIDCHTHLVHAGSRADEFKLRLDGATYEEIARRGGGIVSSINAVREASESDLLDASLPRLDRLIAEGVTTIEVKSGYGLAVDAELKMLRVGRRLAEVRPVRVGTSYLGAHALPPDYRDRRERYLADVVLPGLRAAADAGLADAVDGFCEGIAFSPDEMRRVFAEARTCNLPVKLHADQLSNLHGAALAAEFAALSADHLEYCDEDGAAAMAESGTVAVLLPGAFYFLRETRKPPVESFRRHGVPMAVATDNNPGTSPLSSILLAMNMAAVLFGLTVEECLAGATREAARALGIGAQAGTLEVGKWADLAVWSVRDPTELVYRMGFNPLHARVFKGNVTS